MAKLKKADWILLVLNAAGEKPLSPVQLQKALFLLQQELPKEIGGEFYCFTPYNYGPFDSAIYSDADVLANERFVAVETPPGQRWPSYSLTPAGKERAELVSKEASPRAVAYLQTLTTWVLSVSFRDLLKAVYSKYPDFAVNSVFKG